MTQSALKALAIIGPTASGKTAHALQVAQHFPVEIISLDSALVYRGMDVGTAKPSVDEQKAVPHHLLDIISPLETYSAAQFVSDCENLCRDIQNRGRLPLIVGGTMMYFHALKNGLSTLPQSDETVRQSIQALKQQHGNIYLYQRLSEIDPLTAKRLEPNDTQRIMRALEVYELTNQPLSDTLATHQRQAPTIRLHSVLLFPENRIKLHRIVAERFHAMINQGLADEVISLKKQYPTLNANMPSMRCVGYRQTWDYLAGSLNHKEWQEKGIIATRQLAKRQITWMRKLGGNTIIDPFNNQNSLQSLIAICQTLSET